jgi:signal transduction histidine kinase
MTPLPPHLHGLCTFFVAQEISSVLRHDLRNKLSAVRYAIYFLTRKADELGFGASDPRIAQFFKVADDELAASEGLLGDRIAALPKATEPPTPVESTLRALVEQLGHPKVRLEAAPAVRAAVPAPELSLAAYCLLENAIEAIDAGGGGAVVVRCAGRDERAVIEIVDQGPGLPPDGAERVLEPFFTTKPGRLGLGLNVARRIAERWGGAVSLAPQPEGGVRASLALPVG